MDARKKLVELQDESDICPEGITNCIGCKYHKEYAFGKPCDVRAAIADKMIANGVTVQEWVPVTERLPEEKEYVMIWCGECQIARIEKGITEEQRKAMKRGDLDDPCETGWTSSGGYFTLKRSESYRACDEGWNNKVPYCWYVNGGVVTLFGQNVTHWMPLPEPPKGE